MSSTSEDARHAPVFVFAASWRTGSTLIQRIICASNDIFIWGEPQTLDRLMDLYNRMLKVQEGAKLSEADYARRSWIPTLLPSASHIKDGFRCFMEELYYAPIRARGYKRWGFKEVRKNAVDMAGFLYELFPAAKFIFLVRNPLDTYLSVKNAPFISTFADPFDPVYGWHQNAAGFLEVMAQKSLPAILVRYEDLTGDESLAQETMAKICSHAGIPFTFHMFRELTYTAGKGSNEQPLTQAEREKIISETSAIAARLGYELT